MPLFSQPTFITISSSVAPSRSAASASARFAAVEQAPSGKPITTQVRTSLRDGATELDMVMNVGWLKSGMGQAVQDDIGSVVAAAGDDAIVKVILECALLSEEEKVLACGLSVAAGAAFVKTSTGFGPGGATVADVRLLKSTVAGRAGVKASGGIRDLATARAMIEAGADRLGTSSGVAIVEAARLEGD